MWGLRHWRDREESFEANQAVKGYLPLGCWLRIYYGDSMHMWFLGAVVYQTLLEKAQLKTVEVQTEYLEFFTRNIKSLVWVWSVWFAISTRHPLLGTTYQYNVDFFIYFGSLQISYIDKVCHNNIDNGCLHEHYMAVKYVTVWSHSIHW